MVLSFTLPLFFVYETIISFLPIMLTITRAYLLCLKSRHHLHMSAQVVSAIAALQEDINSISANN